MNIGNRIKTGRQLKGLTQERLAETLGVSVSAVSLWECGKTMPDITLIPAICSVLEISANELFEIDLAEKSAEIERIIEEARKFGNKGYTKKALEILDEGMRKYPDSFELMDAASTFHFRLMHDGETEEERQLHRDKTVSVCERILERCTKSSFRHSAVQKLCMVYADSNPTRAEKLLDESCSIYVSKEMLATHVYKGSRRIASMRDLVCKALDILTGGDMWMNPEDDSGNNRYTDSESAEIYEKIIAIYHTVFENGDFGFYHVRLSGAHAQLAKHYAEKRNTEKTLYHLESRAYHTIEFIKIFSAEKIDYEHTSIAVRGKPSVMFSTNRSENDAQLMKNTLKLEWFDFVRDTERFKKIAATLDEYAGEW